MSPQLGSSGPSAEAATGFWPTICRAWSGAKSGVHRGTTITALAVMLSAGGLTSAEAALIATSDGLPLESSPSSEGIILARLPDPTSLSSTPELRQRDWLWGSPSKGTPSLLINPRRQILELPPFPRPKDGNDAEPSGELPVPPPPPPSFQKLFQQEDAPKNELPPELRRRELELFDRR